MPILEVALDPQQPPEPEMEQLPTICEEVTVPEDAGIPEETQEIAPEEELPTAFMLAFALAMSKKQGTTAEAPTKG